MQKFTRISAFFTLILAMVFAVGCKPEDNPNSDDVTVTTADPKEITPTTAICGASVTVSEGVTLSELGVCWSTQENPTASDDHLSTSVWNSPFSDTLTNLEPNTEYHVRAYALRDSQYYYGEDKTFTTVTGGGGNPSVLTTITPSEITYNSAVCGAKIILGEGVIISELGVCWSTKADPTADDAHLSTTTFNETFTCTLTNLEPSTEYHVRAYAMLNSGYLYGEDKSFVTDDDDRWVDLGLPSGTLWAKWNVGANAPEEYGDYFAWGETEPKEIYDWNSYKYGYEDEEGIHITKYNDYPDILQPEDDAATTNWGSDARTPTREEWEELWNTCTSVWASQNGVNGRCITGPNGEKIFLPATGYREDNELGYVGTDGLGWTSTLYIKTYRSYYSRFDSEDHYVLHSMILRNSGQTVRPVRSARQN